MAKPGNVGAASTDDMHLVGLVALRYMPGRIGKAAREKRASGNGDAAFLRAKLVTGRFFAERVMPETAAHLARLASGAETMMALEAEAF